MSEPGHTDLTDSSPGAEHTHIVPHDLVTASGRLLGVISWDGSDGSSSIPVAHMALPQWVLARIGMAKAV